MPTEIRVHQKFKDQNDILLDQHRLTLSPQDRAIFDEAQKTVGKKPSVWGAIAVVLATALMGAAVMQMPVQAPVQNSQQPPHP